MSAVTDAVVLSVFGAGAAGIGVYAARHKMRNRRRYKLAELTDPGRDIDRDPEAVSAEIREMHRPGDDAGWPEVREMLPGDARDWDPPDGGAAA